MGGHYSINLLSTDRYILGAYDYATIHPLINTAPILHVSFTDPTTPFPVTLPMIGSTGNFSDPSADPNTSAQDIYLHGHISSRLMRKGKDSSSTEEGGEDEGLPITVSATHMDGLVLALSAFHHSMNYRSAVCYGYATLVTDPEETIYAMTQITNSILPNRWENTRLPPFPAEVKSTGILRVRVVSASAKVRTGGPSEDRKDLKDEELRARVWTGVVPSWRVWGELVPAEECRVQGVPGDIEAWRVKENEEGKVGAYEAISKE